MEVKEAQKSGCKYRRHKIKATEIQEATDKKNTKG